jgi:hypothetical protein
MNPASFTKVIRARVVRECAEQIRNSLFDVERALLQSGSDRWLSIFPNGGVVVTGQNRWLIQSEIPLWPHEKLTESDIRGTAIQAIVDAIIDAGVDLIDSNTGESIREATPLELFDSWQESEQGHIVISDNGQDRVVYAEIR